MQNWKSDLIGQAKRQILLTTNMGKNETSELVFVLSDYLEEGIAIIKSWRKLNDESEFESGKHNSALIVFMKNKYYTNGRELFDNYSSGGVSTSMKQSPESLLKSSCKQVM